MHAGATQEVLDATIDTSSKAAQRGAGRKWYFEKLDLQGIRCNLTLVPHGGYRDSDPGSSTGVGGAPPRTASTLGIPIIEINSVPLRVNALQLRNAFVTPRALLSQLVRHLLFQVRADLLACDVVAGLERCTASCWHACPSDCRMRGLHTRKNAQ